MKKTLPVLVFVVLIIALSGCRGGIEEKGIAEDDIKTGNERLVKEFKSTVNIFHRIGDNLLLSAEENENYKYYEIDISSAEVKEDKLAEMSGIYVYQEAIGNRGYIVVEELENKNTLKLIDRDGSEIVIAEGIGPAEAINISIAPNAGKLVYAMPVEVSDTYGLYVFNVGNLKSHEIMRIENDGLAEDFSYLANWSPDGRYIIVQDKYIIDTDSGAQIGEIKSAYSQWSSSSRKIAFIPEDGSQPWLSTTDYYVYPGKKICIYDISEGSFEEIFEIGDDEYIFGSITWDGGDRLISFPGIKVGDMTQPDWYMKLNYSSLYILDIEGGRIKRLETNVDASDGTMIELANLKFTNGGKLLSFTIGNYEKCSLNILNTETLDLKTYEDAEYLHWIDGEDYSISAGQDKMYFSRDNSIIRIDERLQEKIIYTSASTLDDFYISGDEKGILIFELQGDVHTVRYIGE